MSPTRLQILAQILHTDVQFLADIGLLDLKEEGPRNTLRPVAKYKEIELPFAA